MEYQKIANLLESTSDNLSKFRTRNWVEINDESRGNYANSDIRFKTTMLRSNLCDYPDSYILVKGTITITGAGANADARNADERDKGVTFKNCAPFTKCISTINNADIDNALDIVMPVYNLIEYSDNYSKTSGSLWKYYKDDPNDNLANSKSFKSKVKITGKIPAADNTKDVEIIVPLKYLSNFWRTLEIPLINCEVNLILTWSKDCVITNSTGEGKFAITETKLYVPVVTLSTKDNEKLLQKLKSGFKKAINWNKYESSIKTFAQNRYLYIIDYLINPSFQRVNRFFVLSFENENDRTSHSTYYLPKVELKDYNVMVGGRNLFDQPINSMNKTYENIRKIAAGKGDDYTTGCLLDYPYFKENYKMIAIDLSSQNELDADPRGIQQINFTANLDRAGNTRIFFITEEAKETIFEFSLGTVKVL